MPKPHQGPKPSAQPRTLRGRALEKGTMPGGFTEFSPTRDPLDATSETVSEPYRTNVTSPGQHPTTAGTDDPSPFKLGPQ